MAASASCDGKVLGAVGIDHTGTAFDGHCSVSRHVLCIMLPAHVCSRSMQAGLDLMSCVPGC